jgi:protocatechuate 4,5-dioxygenase beta chain
MIGLGLACSHSAGLFRPVEVWREHLRRLPQGLIDQFPTAQREDSDPDYVRDQFQRVQGAFKVLRDAVAAYKPDAIIMVGDDQGDMYDMSNNPAISVFTGTDRIWGKGGYEWNVAPKDRTTLYFDNHVELSRLLLKGLIKRGFDVSNSAKFVPVGKPDVGASHMVSRIVPELDPSGKIPIICVFINEYFPPLPTAARCAQLGAAIRDVFSDRPERLAICASGGLSHYNGLHHQGAVDIPLDTWVLEQIANNDIEALKHLFAVESDNMNSGTGEIRAWITAAAAMDRKATIIDYLPIHSAFIGCGFAYWPDAE